MIEQVVSALGLVSIDRASLLALLGLGAAAAALLLHVRGNRARRRLEARLAERIEQLGRDVAVMCAAASAAGDRLVSVERRAQALQVRQDEAGAAQQPPERYRQAAALLARGATTEELIEVCGMVQGEAELVAYLHASPSQLTQ